MEKTYWKEGLAVLLVAVIIVSEALYRQYLFTSSKDIIIKLQAQGATVMTEVIIFITSALSRGKGGMILLLVIYNFFSRRTFMHMCLAYFATLITLSYIKIFYHAPRPFFIYSEIIPLKCYWGYGNPSGHTCRFAAFYGTLWLLCFTHTTPNSEPLFDKPWKKQVLMWSTLGLFVIFLPLLCYNRMYLGAHSLNQMIFGLCLGLLFAYLFGFVLPEFIDRHYDSVRKLHKTNTIPTFTIVFIIAVAVLQIINPILFAAIRNSPHFLDPSWIEPLNAKCPEIIKNGGLLLTCFYGILKTSLLFFLYLEQMISSRYFHEVFKHWSTNVGVWRLLLRLVFLTVLVGICIIPTFLTKKSSLGITISVGIILPALLIPFAALLTLDWISSKLHLYSQHEKLPQTLQYGAT